MDMEAVRARFKSSDASSDKHWPMRMALFQNNFATHMATGSRNQADFCIGGTKGRSSF